MLLNEEENTSYRHNYTKHYITRVAKRLKDETLQQEEGYNNLAN